MENVIKLYNTKTRTLEEFKPITANKVGIYSCGPTVYHYVHLGNLRAYVFADILQRMFISQGYTVTQIINVTDIGHLVGDGDIGDDKMTRALLREGKPLTLSAMREVANQYFDYFKKDCEALNIIPPSRYPFASDHVYEDIELIKILLSKQHAYATTDGIYFDVSTFDRYTELARLNLEGLESGARVAINTEKRNGSDFALWKFNSDLGYEAPFGNGFPGWHIECSAMAIKYLGNHFDIHTGGIDHIPVHHTNEIAQSECATEETYVNYWMHVNFLNDTTGKMSKSNNDFLTLNGLIKKGYNPLAYRYFLLMTHYRKEITFSYEALDAASVAYEKLTTFVHTFYIENEKPDISYMNEARALLADDLATPQVIALMFKLIKDNNVVLTVQAATIVEIGNLLGLDFKKKVNSAIVEPKEVTTLLIKRAEARKNKDFSLSDALRDEIATHGFIVKDTPSGQELIKA